MTRRTVDYGIDLGTTNSGIARMSGGKAEVIKNNEDIDITPSVVWLGKDEQTFVGRRSKERLEEWRVTF